MFTVGPGLRVGGEGMVVGSSGWQVSWYPVRTPLVTAGSCHEKLMVVVVTDVIWNIRGGSGATGGRKCESLSTHIEGIDMVILHPKFKKMNSWNQQPIWVAQQQTGAHLSHPDPSSLTHCACDTRNWLFSHAHTQTGLFSRTFVHAWSQDMIWPAVLQAAEIVESKCHVY